MLPSGNSLLPILLNSLDVEVNFNEPSYTAAESDGEVSISLLINGQFYVPLWVIVEINDGTATGGLYKVHMLQTFIHRHTKLMTNLYIISLKLYTHPLASFHCDACLQTLKTTPVQHATM